MAMSAQILAYLARNPAGATTAEMARELNLTTDQIGKACAHLWDSGRLDKSLLRRSGRGGNMYCVWRPRPLALPGRKGKGI